MEFSFISRRARLYIVFDLKMLLNLLYEIGRPFMLVFLQKLLGHLVYTIDVNLFLVSGSLGWNDNVLFLRHILIKLHVQGNHLNDCFLHAWSQSNFVSLISKHRSHNLKFFRLSVLLRIQTHYRSPLCLWQWLRLVGNKWHFDFYAHIHLPVGT